MITETITRIKLTASESMMLTDGENYGKEVFLAANADASVWHEITMTEYEHILAEEQDVTQRGGEFAN